MKSITNILRRSDITPYERVKALVHNDVYMEKTGKDNLSESDLYVLTKGWNPNKSEADEYNKYINIVQLENLMKMDAQMFLCRSEVVLLRNQRALDSFLFNTKRLKNISNKIFAKDISIEECSSFLTKHTYLEYEKTLHIFTFHNLPKEIQDDLLLLDEEFVNDEKYIEDQVFLYEIFRNGNTLNKHDKDLIVSRIYSHMYHEEIKNIKNSTVEKDGYLLNTFFAELPIKNLFQKLVDDAHIVYDKEDPEVEENLLFAVEKYAKTKNVSIELLIKEKISIWLDEGLFVKDYSPLFISEHFDTWNGNTKNNHKVLFMDWYTEMQKSKQYFQELFDTGKLNKQVFEQDYLGTPRILEIITGDSLYACKEDIVFVKEYRQQIEILMPMSGIFLFVKKHAMPIKNYKTLCEFKNLAQKVSSIFDIDMTENYTEFINSYQEEIVLLNHSLNRLIETEIEHLYMEESLHYILDINDKYFTFDFNTDESIADIAKKYIDEFKKLER